MTNQFIKTKRTFTKVREYGWIITLLVAIGGLWQPKLGLIVLFIMAGLVITSFFKGRYWCGNICPHGSVFDKLLLPISKVKELPKFLKSKYMGIGFFLFFMYNFTRKMLGVFNSWGTYDFLDRLGLLFSNTYLMVLIIGGGLSILINPRTWCQFCPMGTMQKLSYKLGNKMGINQKTEKKLTIADKSLCYNCGKCSKVCPFQLEPHLEFSDKNQFDNTDCIKCSTCVENCPAKILSFKTENEALSSCRLK